MIKWKEISNESVILLLLKKRIAVTKLYSHQGLLENRRNYHSLLAPRPFWFPTTHEIVTMSLYQLNFYAIYNVIKENVTVLGIYESLKHAFYGNINSTAWIYRAGQSISNA